MDHIRVVNQVIEKSADYTVYEKAFDSALTAAVLEALTDQGVEETHIRLLDDIYKGRTGSIDNPSQAKRQIPHP